METALVRLADRFGILREFRGADGVHRETSDAARIAILAALGVDAATEAAAARALADTPTDVVPEDDDADVTPCLTLEEKVGERRLYGLWANLYSLRSDRGLGIGNLTDLAELARFARRSGASFVGISPLHATRNRFPEISPYSAISRIYRNPIYLDVETVPEFAACDEARALLRSADARERLRALRGAERIDYAAIAELQRPVLSALAAACMRSDGERARACRAFRDRDGGLAADFATFLVLEDAMERAGHGVDWRRWPEEMRDPRSAAVQEFRDAHRAEVDVHVFAQFEIEEQLGRVAAATDMPLGIYQDLALGSLMSGFDAWAFPDLFVGEASLGAPPDAYAIEGQNWGIPPLDPRALARDDYRYWRLVVRSAMTHAGALRIDHAMGLLRQFWVPATLTAIDGAYVRYPLHELLKVLAEESHRSGCIVIGEDLGTVPPGFDAVLASAGILSSRVLLFEREEDGAFRSPAHYSDRALVTANTHDHPTLAAYLRGHDLKLRHRLGLVEGHDAFAERRRDLDALRTALAAEKLVAAQAEPTYPELCAAVYEFLSRTPAPLLGVSLDDVAGEVEPVNIPGVPQTAFPSWTRRMKRTVAELARGADVVRVLERVGRR